MKAELPKRRLIPRWTRKVLDQPLSAGNASVIHAPEPTQGKVLDLISEISEDSSLGVLGDVISLAMFPSARPHLVQVAETILSSGNRATRPMTDLARLIVTGQPVAHQVGNSEGLGSLRGLLRDAPDDVPALLDVAQLHAANGKVRAADRALIAALQLAPHSREVLRTRARFLVHVGRPDEAHALLSKSPRAKNDPWLMASEIAVADSASTQSRLIGKARRLLLAADQYDHRMVELAGALAAVEMTDGNFKAARSLYRRALASRPTANVIAQAVNDGPVIGLPVDPSLVTEQASAHEASVIEAYRAMDLARAEAGAEHWHREEPFSSRPLLLLSFLCSCRGDAERAVTWASLGTRGESNDPALWGNRAYALAALGRLEEAQYSLNRSARLDHGIHQPQILATQGMILLRRGLTAEGRALYEHAISELVRRKSLERSALCRAFFAREAVVLQLEDQEHLLAAAVKATEEHGSTEAHFVLASIGALPTTALAEKAGNSLRWVHDPVRNVLTRVDRRTREDTIAEEKRLGGRPRKSSS